MKWKFDPMLMILIGEGHERHEDWIRYDDLFKFEAAICRLPWIGNFPVEVVGVASVTMELHYGDEGSVRHLLDKRSAARWGNVGSCISQLESDRIESLKVKNIVRRGRCKTCTVQDAVDACVRQRNLHCAAKEIVN